MDSRFLTVAGAAQDLRRNFTLHDAHLFPVSPDDLKMIWPSGHLGHTRCRAQAQQRGRILSENRRMEEATGQEALPLFQTTFKNLCYCLTAITFSHKLPSMKGDLSALEQKVEQFLAFCQSLRAENQALRSRVAGLEAEQLQLVNKIATASTRLEALMDRLPEE